MVEPGRIEITGKKIREDETPKTLPVTEAASDKSKLLLLVAAGLGILYFINNKDSVNTTQIVGWFAVAAAIYYFTFKDKKNPDYYLTERQAKAVLWDELKFKQHNSYAGRYEIDPADEIDPMINGRLLKIEGVPSKWILGFTLKKPSGLVNMHSGEIDAVNGTLIGIQARPEGFSGHEVNDVKWIRSPQFQSDRRYLEAGGDKVSRFRK